MNPYLYWTLAAIAATLVGFSKTGVPGLGILIVPLLTFIYPDSAAKQSTGALLPMLVFADFFAVAYYRRHAQWSKLWGLLPWVAPGVGAAWYLLSRLHNTEREGLMLKLMIGGIVLGLLVLELARRRFAMESVPHQWWFSATMGILAGFTTTIGNAAGQIMGIYLLSRGLPKKEFIGTGAWYFFIVNWLKVPIFVQQDMITADTLWFDLKLAPAIIVGALVGVRLVPYIPQKGFNALVLILAAVAAAVLVGTAAHRLWVMPPEPRTSITAMACRPDRDGVYSCRALARPRQPDGPAVVKTLRHAAAQDRGWPPVNPAGMYGGEAPGTRHGAAPRAVGPRLA